MREREREEVIESERQREKERRKQLKCNSDKNNEWIKYQKKPTNDQMNRSRINSTIS